MEPNPVEANMVTAEAVESSGKITSTWIRLLIAFALLIALSIGAVGVYFVGMLFLMFRWIARRRRIFPGG